MLQAIIEPISDLATVAAQQVVGFVAERTSLKADGLAMYALKFLVCVVVYLAIVVGVPVVSLVVLFKLVLPIVFA